MYGWLTSHYVWEKAQSFCPSIFKYINFEILWECDHKLILFAFDVRVLQ